jgi:hypothetical protein
LYFSPVSLSSGGLYQLSQGQGSRPKAVFSGELRKQGRKNQEHGNWQLFSKKFKPYYSYYFFNNKPTTTTTMISSFRHLSRSPALQSSIQRYCLRRPSAVYSSPVAAPFSSFFANNGFSSTVPNAVPSTHAPTNGHVLTKADLAQIISAEHDLKLAQSNRILNTLLDTIVEVRVRFYLAYFFSRVMS